MIFLVNAKLNIIINIYILLSYNINYFFILYVF